MTAPKTDPANPNVLIPPGRIKKPGDPEPVVDPEVPPDGDPNEDDETQVSGSVSILSL